MKANIIIVTKRLILRELSLDDTAFIYKIVNTDGWLNNIGDRNVHMEKDAINYLSGPIDSYAKNNYGMWLMEEKSSSKAIGLCGLVNRPSLEDVDIGFALLPEFEKKGFAFEAAKATLHYAKKVLNIEKVVGICNPDNEASIRLLKKLGLKKEKTIRLDNDKDVYFFSPS